MHRLLQARFNCILAFLVGVLAFLAPETAFALDSSYSIDELSTQITVETNAAIHVTERQTLTFPDRNMGVTWYLHVPENGESVRIDGIRVAPVDDGGTLLGDWTRLQMIDSDPDRQGRNPGDAASASLRTASTRPWYSYNIGDGMVRSYFPAGKAAQTAGRPGEAADGGGNAADSGEPDGFRTYLVETDYVVAHRVRTYRDVAELYWRYVNDSLPADSQEVNLQVVLPVPADIDPVTASDNIRAWGHGPENGTFAIGQDGTVTYHIDMIQQGNYAEAHIIFPSSWMTNMAPNAANAFSELRGPSAIAEESEWVDIGLRESAWDNKVRVLFLGIALIVLMAGAVGVLRNGRSSHSRRALIRVATTLGITALGANLFFREPLTTALMALLALIVLVIALALPASEEPEAQDAAGEPVA